MTPTGAGLQHWMFFNGQNIHTHTNTLKHTNTHTHIHTHRDTHTHTQKQNHTYTHTENRITHTHIQKQTHTQTHKSRNRNTHTHRHTYIQTDTHTENHSLSRCRLFLAPYMWSGALPLRAITVIKTVNHRWHTDIKVHNMLREVSSMCLATSEADLWLI